MTHSTTGRLFVGVLAFALVVAGSAGATTRPAQQATTATGSSEGTVGQAQDGECDYAELYEDVATADVEITAHNETDEWGGSGWIHEIEDSTAYVVTNWHVAEQGNPTDLDVRFDGGRWVEGEVVGSSAITDVAVVRVTNVPESATALPVTRDPAERGERIAVFGQPFQFKETITEGIVSGVNRSWTTQGPRGVNRTIAPMIQTDASVEFGHSGGPWVNCQGEVVGMTVGGVTSVTNFGISWQALQVIVPALTDDGSYPLSYLGADTTEVNATVAELNDLAVTRGAMVATLNRDSPARGELRSAHSFSQQFSGSRIPIGGDVVLAVDGVPVEDTADLFGYLYLETRPGETVNFTVLRDGERQTVEVTMGESPASGTTTTRSTTTATSGTTTTEATTEASREATPTETA
ncbi:S1C family serine protease [Halomicrococcus gelatinilyticus]|uniref:S1C family serine protease n=1 Tax=Halomicrococcus gelatinilyticus TaxID=1702103 RepID=UPI002E0FC22B